ncbi:LysM peptidoglycan-binding domain-containing protein [Alkalihalobacillus sp. AL-G]|uniref:cell division suppressor protein YneA n=1 Tax=Alkalihalobacillus sp. AL-G TaxID=2926399 RepID=UPI00272DB79A|nr:LysM peptidoglycan-binding domain-containing protein [Alkalihalobacillus sp. AL-G]WLD95250.1 LysM peptidoglycan-binding domain-containing protein [Alkalihalobacillus sp. AL-G]
MEKSRQNGWSFVIVFIVIMVSMGAYTFITNKSHIEKSYVNVTIEQGDTLWELSEKFQGGHELSHSEFIQWVEQKNEVKADRLQPGKTVVIPVPDGTELVQIASE